jgi:hypothetical protein
MSYSCFIDKHDAPTEQAVQKALGEKKAAWRNISDYLTIDIKAKAKYKYYGKNYGWALGFSKNGKSILSLYPDTNNFCIQFIVNEKQEAKLLKELSNAELRDMIAKKKSIHEGKWIFANFAMFNGIEEIKRIIAIRLDAK